MKNVFDDIAALADKYGNLHNAALRTCDLRAAEIYRSIVMDLCKLILDGGKK